MSFNKTSAPEFEQTIGDLMSALSNIVNKRHRLVLRELDITALQGIELSFIVQEETNGGTSQSVVCELLSVTPPAVLKMTLELEEKGLIFRMDNPNDKRSQLLFPTEEGKRISGEFRKTIIEADRKIYAACSDEEKQTLLEILSKVIQSNR